MSFEALTQCGEVEVRDGLFYLKLRGSGLLYTPGKLNVFSSRKPELRGTSLTEELDALLSSQVIQS